MKNRFRMGRVVAEGLIALGVVLITLSATLLQTTSVREPLLYVSLFLLIAAVLVIHTMCRCPNCGQVILKNLIGATCCPECGSPLWPGAKKTVPAALDRRKKHSR